LTKTLVRPLGFMLILQRNHIPKTFMYFWQTVCTQLTPLVWLVGYATGDSEYISLRVMSLLCAASTPMLISFFL